MTQLNNVNIASVTPLPPPRALKASIPITEAAAETVLAARTTVNNILSRKDHRLLVVVGPCSIHDVDAAKEYAERLIELRKSIDHTIYPVMRVYFEKPRTTVGWKGLINDPYLNDTFQIADGLQIARQLLIDLNSMGIPTATEALDPISPQYLDELITWAAIGARTTESQTHREMSSGLSSAIGFKNGTDGNLDVAINALLSVENAHQFLGVNEEGVVSVIASKGNPYGHIVLRGGGGKPNYDSVNIRLTEQALEKAKLPANIMIDTSHANSNKDPSLQPLVMTNIVNQILEGNQSIIGVMVESHLKFGNQKLTSDLSALEYGVSITDGCIDWDTTVECLTEAADKLRPIMEARKG